MLHEQVGPSLLCGTTWSQSHRWAVLVHHGKTHNKDGPTCSCNIAPLCRRHHRLKTHSGWSYDVLDDATYLWRSPNGLTIRRDHTGTTPLH